MSRNGCQNLKATLLINSSLWSKRVRKRPRLISFFELRTIIEFEDVVIIGRSSVTVLLLVDKDQAYRGHVYLCAGPLSRETTMKGIRASVQNLLCMKPMENVGNLLGQAAQQVCSKLCFTDYDAKQRKETRYLCVDAPCGPMPRILYDLGFRACSQKSFWKLCPFMQNEKKEKQDNVQTLSLCQRRKKLKHHSHTSICTSSCRKCQARSGPPQTATKQFFVQSREPSIKLIRWSNASSYLKQNQIARDDLKKPGNIATFVHQESPSKILYPVSWDFLYQKKSFLILFLTSRDNKFVASVQGQMDDTIENALGEKGSEINYVQVHPDYQGKGICTQLVGSAFKLLSAHHIKKVALSNGAGVIGSKCYEKAARSNRYLPQCRSFSNTSDSSDSKVCDLYSFTLR